MVYINSCLTWKLEILNTYSFLGSQNVLFINHISSFTELGGRMRFPSNRTPKCHYLTNLSMLVINENSASPANRVTMSDSNYNLK
jgi:hypothetical protein